MSYRPWLVMTAVDCRGLLEGTSKWCDSVVLESEDAKCSTVAYSQYGSSHMAVATGSILSLATSNSAGKFEEKCEIEFDNDVEVICWGVDASCLIVGDTCGTLHFVTASGELLFSHRVLAKNEESKFVYLGFKGEGKLLSLIAVFENGKIFGIADLTVDTICHLAKNEPTALSGAIRKMKFMKCNLAADFPIFRAVVYNVPSSHGAEKNSGSDAEKSESRTKSIETSLSIGIVDAKGRLTFGSIGSTSALLSRILTPIKDDSSLQSVKGSRCLDIAITNLTAPGDEMSSTLLALYSDGMIAVIDLDRNIALKTFHLNIPSALRISTISAIPSSSILSDHSASEWEAVVFGIQAATSLGVHTNLHALLSNMSNIGETPDFLLFQLGSESLGGGDQEFIVASSPPGDCLFTTHTDGEGYTLSGRRVSDSVHICMNHIITGLTDISDISDTSDSKSRVSGVSNVLVLIGKLLRLSLLGDSEGENPFSAEELLDDALEGMTSLVSCGEVCAVLNTLIASIVDPPTGFINRSIDAAERAMHEISATNPDPTVKTYLSSISDLRQYVETARCLSDYFPLGDSEECSSVCVAVGEDSVRRRVIVLTGSSPCGIEGSGGEVHVDVWVKCVAAGALCDASLIMSHYLAPSLGMNTSNTTSSSTSSTGRDTVNVHGSIVDTYNSDGNDGRDTSGFAGRCVMSAVRSIPDYITPSEIVTWARSDVLPHLHMLSKERSTGHSKEHSGGRNVLSVPSQLVEELCRRAYLSAELLGHPFEAILAAELAVILASSFCQPQEMINGPHSPLSSQGNQEYQYNTDNQDNPSNLSNEPAEISRTLLRNLEIQAAIWRCWGDKNRPQLDDVADLGLSGLVWGRLWILGDSEGEIREDVEGVIEPVVRQFGLDLDEILQSWVKDAIEERVVLIDGQDENNSNKPVRTGGEDEEEMTCTLSRLVSVVALIRKPHIRVSSLLLLFQVPAVDRVEEHSFKESLKECSSPGDEITQIVDAINDSSIADKITNTKQDKQDKQSRDTSAVDRLCLQARAACSLVEPAAAEALTEAIRLQRIKILAASYRVISFDPRDRHQIRAVASIIALKGTENSLKDAIEFASSWGTDSADLSGLLIRAVVNRSTNEVTQDEGLREQSIRNALVQVPPHRLLAVVEDSCTYLIESLEEICQDSIDEGIRPGQLSTPFGESEAGMLLRSLICIITVFLDTTRDGEEVSKKKSGNENSYARVTASPSSSWVNADLLSSAKRLKLLQSAEGIFLSFTGLRDMSVCKIVAAQMSEIQADKIIAAATIGPISSTVSRSSSYEKEDKLKKVDSEEVECRELVSALTPEIRRLCSLLSVSPFLFAHTVIKKLVAKGSPGLAMDVAKGLETESSSSSSSSAVVLPLESSFGPPTTDGPLTSEDLSILLETAVTLCSMAAKPNRTTKPPPTSSSSFSLSSLESITRPFTVSRDLLRGVTSTCPAEHLGPTLDILNGSELVLAVYQRVEGMLPEDNTPKSKSLKASALSSSASESDFKIAECSFQRDGILMAPGAVLGHLLRYSASEVRRRISATSTSDKNERNSGNGERNGGSGEKKSEDDPAAVDLEELVCVLQRSENHLLAVRVLLSSWHLSDRKAQLLRSSLLSLSRKVLSYREIDTSLAVACLVMLPYDAMVRELKAAVPSIQSDFSRLRTVASVGEELARLWDQDALLVVFQGLQTNAKWWHILSLHGVKIDPRSFQSSDTKQRDLCVRAVVPELLELSNMDLEQAVDYCRQFDIEPEYASLCYLEKILLQPPQGVPPGNIQSANDAIWAKQVRKATINVEEKCVLTALRSLLPRIHPLDYEKIRFVCTWIVAALAEEVEMELDNTCQREERESKGISGSSGVSGFSGLSGSENKTPKPFQPSGGGSRGESKPRSESYSEIATAEAESCRRYADIVTYLSGVIFPLEATKNIAKALERNTAIISPSGSKGVVGVSTGSTDRENCYEGVPVTYQSRLPFWALLSDPWLVVTPLLDEAPEVAAKLMPVCRALNIDKDEFAVRRVMAAYNRIMGVVRTTDVSVQGVDAAYDLAVRFIPSITCVARRVRLWQWLYSQEREKKKDTSAMRFLLAGLEDISAYKRYLKSSQSQQMIDTSSLDANVDEILSLREQLRSQLVHLKVEGTLRTFDQSIRFFFATSSDRISAPSFAALLLPHIEEPSLLLRKALIVAAECSWDAQLWSLRSQGSEMLTSQEITHRPLVPAVLAILKKVGHAITEIAAHTQHIPDSKDLGSDSRPDSNAPRGDINRVESLRHGMIGKMLADVDPLGPGGKETSTNSNVGVTAPQGGLWSQIEESSLRVGVAEMRRREDVYLGFCIAALVGSCEDTPTVTTPPSGPSDKPSDKPLDQPLKSAAVMSKRSSYVMQLQAVVLGKGAKSQRRLTTRSRLRAAYALQLILAAANTYTSTTISGNNGDDDSKSFKHLASHISSEVPPLVPFLFCLAELQETRLPCSEEALMSALTHLPLTAQSGDKHERTDARLLVRTWLHDEGYHREVVELGRDVLFSAGVSDVTAWEGLLKHMDQKNMIRSFIQTLILLQRLDPRTLGGVIKGHLKDTVLNAIRTFAADLVEKTDQVTVLIESRGEESKGEIGSSLHSTSTDSSSAGDFMSPSSSRVVLVERCHSSLEWEDAPEDLALSLAQLSVLRTAVAAVCGVQGVRDTAVRLVRTVSFSLASVSDGGVSVDEGREGRESMVGVERGRGVGSLIRHHAEVCALNLLLLSAPLGCPSSSSSTMTVEEEEECAVILSILEAGQQAGSGVELSNKSRKEAQLFLWRLLRTCYMSFSARCVRNALEALCFSSGVKSISLQILLAGASDNWHKDRESRNTTLLLLSVCITVVQVDPGSSDSSSVASSLLSGADVAGGKDLISSSLAALSVSERKSLGLAVELLASQLSVAERAALKYVF